MKKGNIITAVIALVIIALASSCSTSTSSDNLSENPDSLMKLLSQYNAKLPVTFGNGDILDSVYYDGGGHRAVFNYIVDNNDVTIETLASDAAKAKELLKGNIATSEDALAMYKELAQNEIDVRTVLLSTRSRTNTPIDLSADEINGLTAMKDSTTKQVSDQMTVRDSLDMALDSINALFPDTIDQRTVLTKVQVENNYVVYNYVCDEGKNTTMDRMKGEMGKKKAASESQMRKPTPELEQLMTLCVDNGLGIKHRFVGKSTKQTQDYSFSAVDLSKITGRDLPEDYEEIKDLIDPKKYKKKTGSSQYEEGIY